ncbi:hypothetical protein Q5P01_009449 [Channa striata]|uniref:Ubiquitin carboxyl-terminal hydrolase MINDY n=1 Tax=Channa striata TaxID=64152 RepID=A0AA88N257_CHASR|nr:hypothetical protein Q5P01_009449 [Channa striata]
MWPSAPQKLLDLGKDKEQEEGLPTSRTLSPLCSIPIRLMVSLALGGAPVTPQLTESLRKILFGGTFYVFSYDWRKSLYYALETDRGGAGPIQMVVQARVIKHLLFLHQSSSDTQTLHSLSQGGQQDQKRALAAALSDSLWLAGQEASATITLVTEDYCITPQLDYKLDDFTEKLQLFTFTKKEDVMEFILEHVQCFTDEGSHGVILFLYSLIFSRTVDRVKEDLNFTTCHLLHLRLGNFSCHQALLNLLLTGRASPHVFNGTLSSEDDGHPVACPLQGILSRSDMGYLHWNQEQMETDTLPKVGSMLKTPRFPIWLCCINRTYSVLFSVERALLSDWRKEQLFHLYYYNGQRTQRTTARLTVGEDRSHSGSDTQSHHWEPLARDSNEDPEKRLSSLEMTIRTKWDGATVHWKGTSPFY